MGDTQHMTQLVLSRHNYNISIAHCGDHMVGDTQHMTQLVLGRHDYNIPIAHCGGQRGGDTQHMTHRIFTPIYELLIYCGYCNHSALTQDTKNIQMNYYSIAAIVTILQ